ncbi:MAG: DUF3006 domain-containing protein [Heliobacteriaceae bacterium]|nr:DUF3006 domain-containing protein [Heliobacteriaceae bacterium]
MILDRFEENWAVLEREDRTTFRLPRDLLPAGVREGDVLSLTIRVDPETTAKRRETVQKELDGFFTE